MGAPGVTINGQQLSLVSEHIGRTECCVLLPESPRSPANEVRTQHCSQRHYQLQSNILLETREKLFCYTALRFSGNSNSKEHIIRMGEEKRFWADGNVSVIIFIGSACFHLCYHELISKQLEVDNVFISISLSAPSFLSGYEGWEFLLQ